MLDCHHCNFEQEFYVVNTVNLLMNLYGEYIKVAVGVLGSSRQPWARILLLNKPWTRIIYAEYLGLRSVFDEFAWGIYQGRDRSARLTTATFSKSFMCQCSGFLMNLLEEYLQVAVGVLDSPLQPWARILCADYSMFFEEFAWGICQSRGRSARLTTATLSKNLMCLISLE